MEIVEGGFFLRKKPLGCKGSVQCRIENAGTGRRDFLEPGWRG